MSQMSHTLNQLNLQTTQFFHFQRN